jgi:hypothetical protein
MIHCLDDGLNVLGERFPIVYDRNRVEQESKQGPYDPELPQPHHVKAILPSPFIEKSDSLNHAIYPLA